MTEPMTNAERLAALLDGQLDAHRREELIAELAASDDDFDAYVDAVAITAELEAAPEVTPIDASADALATTAELEGAAPEVTPIHAHPDAVAIAAAVEDAVPGVTPIGAAPSRRRSLAPRWMAIAAVLAGVALAPWLWTRFAADRGLVAIEAAALPAGWDASPWGTTRGAGDPMTDEARAVRLGARLVDVELAVRGRDPAAAQLATETAILLEGISGAAPTAGIYHELARRAGEPAERLEPLLELGRKTVPQIAGEEGVKLGAWIESARIAAANRDRGFFASRATRSRLERMARDSSLSPAARSAVTRIQAEVGSGAETDWSVLGRELAQLLRVLGG